MEKVKEAIIEAADEELRENPDAGPRERLLKKHEARAERIITTMRAKMGRPPIFSIFVR